MSHTVRAHMMHQQGSLVSPLLSGVFCQCRSDESHQGADPGGGVGDGGTGTGAATGAPTMPPNETRECPLSESKDGGLCDTMHNCPVCGGPEQEHRLKVLFQILDVNRDGGICVNDLTIGLKKLGVHRTEHELMVSNLTQTSTLIFP